MPIKKPQNANCSYSQSSSHRLEEDINKMLDEKVAEIFMYFQERMYIENSELPFDLGTSLDAAQRELTDKIIEVLRFQQKGEN